MAPLGGGALERNVMAGMAGRLASRVALVTGAGGGIGRATVERLAVEGAAVVAGDLRGYAPVIEAVRTAGGRALVIDLDVTSAASAGAAVDAAIAEFGGLHILVNNAGIAQRGQLEELSEADWDRVLAVNLKGPFLCARAAAPYLAGGGAIVNVASLAGRSSSPLQGCHYSASKAGLLGLTRHLARELGPRRIRVNAVCPGPIMTDMLAQSGSAEHIAELAAQVPIGRAGTPDDIAGVIAFLASDDAAYINGASLDANGGIFMA
jgi:3-oxoacyl-[acyl-carrier protein] reductase